MKDVEPEDTVFSKAETFGILEGIDDFDDFDIGPQIDEFADLDNSLDFDFEEDEAAESVEEAMSKVQQDYLSRRTPITKDEFAERLENEDEILIFTGDPREAGIRGRDYFAAKVDGKYEVSFWDETYEDDFTDSEVAETFDNIDDLWAFMVNFMEDDDFNPEYNYLAEGCSRKPVNENALRDGGFRADGYRTALACYDTDDFDINVEFGMQDEDEYEVEDQLYLLRPGQTVADLVVYLSRECGFTNIYVYGETGAYGNDRKTATKFETVPGKHDYRDYGTIDGRLVEKCNAIPEGMTIEQLQEEMEENEDTVECSKCGNLVEKANCHHNQEGFGWCCNTCEPSNGDLEEDLALTEGKYDFPHLTTGDGKLTLEELRAAKNDIIAKLEARGFAKDGVLMLPILQTFNTKMWIVDIALVGGKVEVVVKKSYIARGSNTPEESYFNWELKRAISEVKDLKHTYNVRDVKKPLDFLEALTEVAGEVNSARNLGVSMRRTRRVATMVGALDPKVADELRQQIRRIKFKIPTDSYSWQDIQRFDELGCARTGIDLASEDMCKQVAETLKNIHNNFLNLNLLDAEYEERYISENMGEPAAWITSKWGAEGVIFFKCPIGKLSAEAQQLIKDTKFEKSSKDKEQPKIDPNDAEAVAKAEAAKKAKEEAALKAKSINNYRLAVALCQHFDNDAKFYEKSSSIAESSLSGILRNVNDEYGTSYDELGFIDSEGLEDIDAFADIETQNEITAEAQRNQKRRQAYAINKAKAAKTPYEDNPFNIDFPEV